MSLTAIRKIVLSSVLAAAVIGSAAACGQPLHAGAASQLTAQPLDAELVTPDFGWVLTPDQVLLTYDGGRSFTAADLKLPPSGNRAAFFDDADHGWVASLAGTGIAVGRTSDGGLTWQTTQFAARTEIGGLDVAFAGPQRGALMARVRTGTNFSASDLYTTVDGGGTWARHPQAPVAGKISIEPNGRIWLAGGVLQDRLYSSTDQAATWKATKIVVPSGAKIDGIAPPVDGVLSVRMTDAQGTRVGLFSTPDSGATWKTNGAAVTGPDRAATAVAVRDGALVQPATVPDGVSRLTFADQQNGWAYASTGKCEGFKSQCSVTTEVAATDDGGSSWHTIVSWVTEYE